jgi:hypothetical protein
MMLKRSREAAASGGAGGGELKSGRLATCPTMNYVGLFCLVVQRLSRLLQDLCLRLSAKVHALKGIVDGWVNATL